jgi:hypothetical protein
MTRASRFVSTTKTFSISIWKPRIASIYVARKITLGYNLAYFANQTKGEPTSLMFTTQKNGRGTIQLSTIFHLPIHLKLEHQIFFVQLSILKAH